jgi:type I restriction enzyme S subunit
MNKNKHIPQGYKDSPLGIIPEEWEVKRLGDLCYNQGDYGLNAPAVEYSKDLPTYLRITDIDDNGKLNSTDKKSVNNPSAEDYYLNDGDIVFARTGATVGKAYLYSVKDGQLVYAGFLIKFSPNPHMLLPYFLKVHTETQHYNNWVAITSQRSGQPGINATEYCSFRIALPQIKEQERICSVLQLWDTAIEKQSELIEKLKLRKHALMQQLLTGKNRLPGFSGEWKRVSLKSFATEVSVKNKENKDYNVLSCTKYDGLVPSLEYFGKQIYSNDLGNYKIVPMHHFAYATNHIEEGSIGYQSKYEYGLISPMYTVFKTDKDVIDDIFLFAVLKSHHLTYLYQSMMEGSINRRGGLRWDSFSTIKIDLPPLNEQKAISAFLKDADKEIELANEKLARLQSQKRGLMQQLLTGKKRIIHK